MSRTPPGRGWRSLDVTAATTGPADLTDYIPDRILIAGHDRGSQLELLTAAAERRGWSIEPDPRFGVRGSSREESDHPLTRLLIVPGPGSPEPDAFELLELARAADLARFGAPDGNELGFVPGDEYEDPSAERRAGRRLEDRVPPELPLLPDLARPRRVPGGLPPQRQGHLRHQRQGDLRDERLPGGQLRVPGIGRALAGRRRHRRSGARRGTPEGTPPARGRLPRLRLRLAPLAHRRGA
ncbi:hypothetical protein [Salana multivorans]